MIPSLWIEDAPATPSGHVERFSDVLPTPDELLAVQVCLYHLHQFVWGLSSLHIFCSWVAWLLNTTQASTVALNLVQTVRVLLCTLKYVQSNLYVNQVLRPYMFLYACICRNNLGNYRADRPAMRLCKPGGLVLGVMTSQRGRCRKSIHHHTTASP